MCAARKKGTLRRFGRRITEAWPALPYLAYGVYLAWLTLGISGTVWLSDVETDGAHVAHFYITLCFACGITCLLAGIFPRYAQILLNKPSFLICIAIISCLGGIATIMFGPYYFERYVSDANNFHTVFFVLMGIGAAVIFLKSGQLYGRLAPRRTLRYALYSQLAMAVLYALTIAAPAWYPVEGGPTLAGILAFCFLPLLAAILLILPVNRRADSTQICEYSSDPRALTPKFARLMVLAFLLSFIIAMMQGGATGSNSPALTTEVTAGLVFLRAGFGIVLLVLLLLFGIQRFNFGRAYAVISVIVVILLICIPVLGAYTDFTNLLVYFAGYVFEFAIFCLLSFIVYQKRIYSHVVFGIGQAVFILGTAIGWSVGSTYMPRLLESGSVHFYIIGALVLLVVGVLGFSERDFNELFKPRAEREPTFESMLQTGDEETSPDNPHGGKFSRALEEIAFEYGLSQRESGIFRYLAMGRNATYISSKLYISRNTVRTHTHNIYTKLDVHSQQELINLVDSKTSYRDSLNESDDFDSEISEQRREDAAED